MMITGVPPGVPDLWGGGEGGIPDADLAALVAAWPTLPEHVRATIRTLIGTVAPTPTREGVLPNLTRALEGRGNSRKPSPEKV